MKNVLRILLLIVLYCSSVYAKASTDSLLYSEFKKEFPLANGQLGTESFDLATKDWSSARRLGKYKALIAYKNIGAEDNRVSWFPGVRVKVGMYDVLHYEVLYSSPKTLYGPIWGDDIVAVYTQSGELVDSRIVVRGQDGFDGEVVGTTHPYNLDVIYKQFTGEDLDVIRMFRRSFSISPHGKIEMSYTPAPPAVYSKMQNARLWPKGRLSNDYLYDYDNISPSEDKMPADFSGYYMPIPDDIHPWVWKWGVRHDDKHYTLLLTKAYSKRLSTEIASSDLYVLTTIDKQGKVIDQRILGRNTPRERTIITSDRPDAITIDNYNLSFRDSYTLEDEAKHSRSIYRVDAQGRISVESLFVNQPIASRQVP